MTDTLREAITDSIEDSLIQLGRGSGITPEHRARMVDIIARPVLRIVDDAATIAYNGGEAALARKTDQTLTEFEQAIVERERARYEGLDATLRRVQSALTMCRNQCGWCSWCSLEYVITALADTPRKDAS